MSELFIYIIAIVLKTVLRVALLYVAVAVGSWDIDPDTMAALVTVVVLCTDIQGRL